MDKINKEIYSIRKGKFGDEIYVKDSKLGGYTSFFREFPNVISQGDTLDEAQANLWSTIYSVLKSFMKK